MKALVIDTKIYGPYNSIEILEDRYRCDGIDLPFGVVGEGEIVDADTVIFPQPITPSPTIKEYKDAVQAHLDYVAALRGYGDEKTAPSFSIATYDNDINPRFASDAATFKSWRSAIWTHCYQVLEDVESGARSAPMIDALLIELPTLIWL